MTGPGPADSAPPDPAPGGAPPPSQGLPTWTSQLTSTAATPGPAGLFYADVPNRAIAYIIDAIILGIVNLVAGAILSAIGLNAFTINSGATTINNLLDYNPAVGLIQAVIFAAISAAYFVYTWTSMRGSPGQKVLGMQVGNAADGATLTTEQAIRRWVALGAPFGIAQALNPLPGLGILIGLAAFVWFIALLVTTAQSPTKQGLHDQFAHTVVVKAARSVG